MPGHGAGIHPSSPSAMNPPATPVIPANSLPRTTIRSLPRAWTRGRESIPPPPRPPRPYRHSREQPALYVMLNLNNNAVGIAGSLEELSAMPTARTGAK